MWDSLTLSARDSEVLERRRASIEMYYAQHQAEHNARLQLVKAEKKCGPPV
jgi:hypothetical protein